MRGGGQEQSNYPVRRARRASATSAAAAAARAPGSPFTIAKLILRRDTFLISSYRFGGRVCSLLAWLVG